MRWHSGFRQDRWRWDRHPRARRQHGHLRDLLLWQRSGGEDRDRDGVGGRGGEAAPGIGRERQFHRRLGERASGPLRIRIAQVYVQQCARRLRGVRVRMIRPRERERQPVRTDSGAKLLPYQPRLRLDVQPGEDERHRVAVPAVREADDLQGRRRRAAADLRHGNAIGAVLPQRDRVEVRDHVRPQVPG